jgi:SAM-dependent methyltransferase
MLNKNDSTYYQLRSELVVMQADGNVDLIYAIKSSSACIMRLRDPLLLPLLAHFNQSNTNLSWIKAIKTTEQSAAQELFYKLVNNGYLIPTNKVNEAYTHFVEPDKTDDILQEIVLMAQQLRIDLKTINGANRLEQKTYTSKLMACYRIFKNFTEQVTKARTENIINHLTTLTANKRNDRLLKLHLGCGQYRLPGWINIDITEGDFCSDLRYGFPYEAKTVSAIYLGHLLEHLDYKEEVLTFLRELHRVLCTDGIIRIVVPNIESFAQAYVANDTTFFSQFEQLWERPKSDTLLSCFLHYAGAGAFPHVLDRHRFGYDAATLSTLLKEAGFKSIRQCKVGDSKIDEPGLDYSWAVKASANGRDFSLIMEAQA